VERKIMTLAITKNKANYDLPDDFLGLQEKLFMLKPIHNKTEYAKAMKIAEMLVSRNDLTKSQSDYLESLVNNIEDYEKSRFETKKQEPIELLKFLLEENNLNGSDLGRILGNRTLGYAILKGQRKLSKTHIVELAEYFSVSPALFL
jgi:HTH-type transcriptional regulator/antitoxin HigA